MTSLWPGIPRGVPVVLHGVSTNRLISLTCASFCMISIRMSRCCGSVWAATCWCVTPVFPGTAIYVFGALTACDWLDDNTLRAEAGVSCARVARETARRGLVGLEFLAGIPGTMGGALAMNAGAFGGETWSRVAAVETVDRHGRLQRREATEYRVGYRSVTGVPGEWFVAAHLRLETGDAAAAQRRIRELLDRRSATQPTNQYSCGSVFRNPPGDHAARLIEAAGLKGRCLGGAQVSEKHANFIVNTGNASATDIETLLLQVQAEVLRVHGVHLEPEVRIVGEDGPYALEQGYE